jgi:hypothetical protein
MKGTISAGYFRARIHFIGELLELSLLLPMQKGCFRVLSVTNIAL